MFDIELFENFHPIKKILLENKKIDKEGLNSLLEYYRNKQPIVYSIETTNNCEMSCPFCPRTYRMTRPIKTLDVDLFKNVINQLKPFTQEQWSKWIKFVEKEYNILDNEMSENHFYTRIIPKCLIFHGFGNPVLDKELNLKISYANSKGFETYFSTNPSSIKHEKVTELFKSGLNYIKFSIDSISSPIRGKNDIFQNYYPKIIKLLDEKEKKCYDTTIVITMIDQGLENQQEEWESLQDHFKGSNLYVYLKSLNQTQAIDKPNKNKSINWNEFCHYAWSSMNIKSNGDITCCPEDVNNNLLLGNIKVDNLYDVWNNDKIKKIREEQINNSCSSCENCDMKQIGYYIYD